VGASTAPKGGRGSDAGGYKETNRRKNEVNPTALQGIKDKVKSDLGLYTNQPGGSSTQTKTLRAYNLKGKDMDFYGEETSKSINEHLVSIGEAQRSGGGGYILTSKGYEMKHGSYTPGQAQTPGAMGSGDPKGILTSTPISKKMLQSQNKFKGLVVGALSLGMPGIGATAMRADAAVALKDAAQPDAAYDDYTKKFNATQQGKKFTSQRNTSGIIQLGLSKGKDKLGEIFGN
tara:strand:+ start:61 stop:756 length:696 start_codon:yes stop_codon:yes gene_type:complete